MGAGATASIAVGGKSHPKVGPPVQMEARVEAVSDGRFVFDTSKRMAGAQGDLGASALLVQGGVSVIVVSKPGQPMCAAKPSHAPAALDCCRLVDATIVFDMAQMAPVLTNCQNDHVSAPTGTSR